MLIHTHVLDGLRSLRDESVHCVVTSPPYFGLRDYGLPESEWGDGWRGQLGLEPTPEQYLGHLVEVFREVRRVLRGDGTLWLNIGDSYGGDRGSKVEAPDNKWPGAANVHGHAREFNFRKQLVGIPWRLALALQAEGWYIRSDIIWHKPNPMPESVTDRPTKSHEYLFLLTKSPRYYYDTEAVKEEGTGRGPGNQAHKFQAAYEDGDERHRTKAGLRAIGPRSSRNRRTVWTIATEPFPEAHFAVFPTALVEPCIKAGTSERGVCPECGAPWERVIERTGVLDASAKGSRFDAGKTGSRDGGGRTQTGERFTKRTAGWRPSCDHDADPVPATVLDTCTGSGTVGVVCARLGRNFIGLELSAEYIGIARRRLADYDLEAAQEAAANRKAATITGPLFDSHRDAS